MNIDYGLFTKKRQTIVESQHVAPMKIASSSLYRYTYV